MIWDQCSNCTDMQKSEVDKSEVSEVFYVYGELPNF